MQARSRRFAASLVLRVLSCASRFFRWHTLAHACHCSRHGYRSAGRCGSRARVQLIQGKNGRWFCHR